MQYTPFGEFFKVLRVKHREILSDASKFLGVSSAYISSVECGKRPVPDEWVDLIVAHYKLSDKEKQKLLEAIENSKTVIKFNLTTASTAQRRTIIQLQRSFEDVDEDVAEEILKILERNNQ